MDAIHDVGGKFGFGPIDVTTDDPPFADECSARMLGIAKAMSRPSDWTSDKFRHTREQEDPLEYLTRAYFDQWYKAYACMMVGSGMVSVNELATGVAQSSKPPDLPDPVTAEQAAKLIRASIGFERPYDGEPAHAPGARVRARLINPPGHCRLPAYVRGHVGEVTAYHGAHVLADAAAHNIITAEPLYTVRFALADLYPEREGSPDTVHLDLWESHLDAA